MQSGQGVSNTANIAASNVDANLIRLEAVSPRQLNSAYMTTQFNNQQLVGVPHQATQFITVQTPGGYQLLPVQGNNSTQYIQLQLQNVQQQGNNLVQIQPNPAQSLPKNPIQTFAPLQPHTNTNSIQQLGGFNQKLSIQLVQQSVAQSNLTAPIAAINSLNTNTSQSQHVLTAPAVSLVGSMSSGLNTPIIRIGNFGPKQLSAAICNSSTSVTTTSSLLKTLKATSTSQVSGNSNNMSSLVSNIPIPTGNTDQFGQSLSGPTTPVLVSQTNTNDQKSFQGAIVVMGGGSKQSTIVPKTQSTSTLHQNSVFVPITVANNVSVLTNQGAGKTFTQVHPGTMLKLHQQQIAPRVTPAVQQQLLIHSNSSLNQQGTQLQLPQQQGSQQIFLNTIPQNLQVNPQPKAILQKSKQARSSINSITKVPISSSVTVPSSSLAESKPLKKPCNCTKSQCLKLYCECFANGEFCSNCNCRMCLNNINHEEERSKAIKSCLDRNPYAFHPKIGKGKVKGDNERRHTKGCNCKRSGCLKNYCECYEAKILCSSLCRCSGCKNFEESDDRKTLMHLADAAEVCVQQQNAAKTKFANQIDIIPKKVPNGVKEKLPVSFLTTNVSRATCDILMAKAAEAESEQRLSADIEKSIIFEFSRCLDRIIDQSHKVQKGKKR